MKFEIAAVDYPANSAAVNRKSQPPTNAQFYYLFKKALHDFFRRTRRKTAISLLTTSLFLFRAARNSLHYTSFATLRIIISFFLPKRERKKKRDKNRAGQLRFARASARTSTGYGTSPERAVPGVAVQVALPVGSSGFPDISVLGD